MKPTTKILIIDDHPMVIRGYQLSLHSLATDMDILFDGATSCDDVLLKMSNVEDTFYDLILLDINLPASSSKNVINGEGLGQQIRSKFPATKIIVQTGLNDVERISNIFKTLKPEGFLIKSEIDEDTLISSVKNVLNNRNYYSEKVKTLLSPNDFDDIYIDKWNRKILYHLSLGSRMKDLPEFIPFSLPTIERRKKELKSLFGIPKASNKELISAARSKGFI